MMDFTGKTLESAWTAVLAADDNLVDVTGERNVVI